MTNSAKIQFPLTQDADEYPPVAVEGIWATEAHSGGYVLDNIPFFTRDATLGDTISTREEGGNLWFSGILARSGNSLLRVVLFDAGRVDELRQQLTRLGCSTEWDEPHKLVSVNVPNSVNLGAIQAYLHVESNRGWLDYEEAILRQ
jgi:Domain of unknown function (DUF4265)